MRAVVLGVDVSKAYLDCFDSLSMKSKRFLNTPKGVKELGTFYESKNIRESIIEATSIYHRLVNPYKALYFAKSVGFLAKTDKVEAKLLCHYSKKVECQLTPYPSSQQEELESLLHYKKALEEELYRQINQQGYSYYS